MNRLRVLFFISVLCAMFITSAVAGAASVGTVTAVQGQADLTRGDDPARPVALGDEVVIGDFLRTKSNARLEVTFIDGSVSRMSSKSRLRVTEFLFDAGERKGKLELFRGKVQSVVAGATPGSSFDVETPTAVCGVRGTTYFVWFQEGVTGGAGSEGTFYVYSKGRPGEPRNVGPGQGFLVRDIDEVPIIRIATDEEMQKHFDDTAAGDGDDNGDEGDDDGDTPGSVAGDISGGTGSGDSGDTNGATTGFDPGFDPTPTDPLFPEPPPEPFTPESPGGEPVIEGTWSDEWSTTNFSFSSETGVLAVDGTINILHSETPAILDFYSWTVPLFIGTETGVMTGLFAGSVEADENLWWGFIPSFYMNAGGDLGYFLGAVPEGTGTLGSFDFEGEGAADLVTLLTGTAGDEGIELFVPDFENTFTDGYYLNQDTGMEFSLEASGFTGDALLLGMPRGEEIGLWTTTLEGVAYSSVDLQSGSWDMFFSIDEYETPLPEAFLVGEGITVDGEGFFEDRVAGSWIDLADALTGVLGGKLKGAFDAEGTQGEFYYWHGVAGGISIGTERFLSMADTAEGCATLDELDIPAVLVGTTNLVQAPNGSGYLSGVYMNDVRFFAYSAGAAPSIWATGNVGGDWLNTPIVGGEVPVAVSLTSNEFPQGVNFEIVRWDSSRWAAGVIGPGTVAGHDIIMQGAAAGAYTGNNSGTFTGTASGAAAPMSPQQEGLVAAGGGGGPS